MELVGYNGNYSVCCGCREDCYTYAIGYRGNEYNVHNDNVIEVDGQDYDGAYLADNDIVKITRGLMADEYGKASSTVTDFFGAIWHENDVDDAVLKLTAGCYEGRFYPADQTWLCAGTGLLYSDCDDSMVVGTDIYEPIWYQNSQQLVLGLNADVVEGNHHV
jgi:hypothetical protein